MGTGHAGRGDSVPHPWRRDLDQLRLIATGPSIGTAERPCARRPHVDSSLPSRSSTTRGLCAVAACPVDRLDMLATEVNHPRRESPRCHAQSPATGESHSGRVRHLRIRARDAVVRPLRELGGIIPKDGHSACRASAIRRRARSRRPAECSTRSDSTTTGSTPSSKSISRLALELGTSLIVNIAGATMPTSSCPWPARLDEFPRIAGLELNISCPNVSGGVDFGTDPNLAADLVRRVREACRHPVIAKLTPNVTSNCFDCRSGAAAGADAVSLVNTFQGLAVDWRRRRPILGAGIGGLSGPAIKPLALRAVWQVAQGVPDCRSSASAGSPRSMM